MSDAPPDPASDRPQDGPAPADGGGTTGRDAASGADEGVEDPPRTLWGTMLRLGPGMIIASAIVGSGELIATTSTGARAGFWLLWLILVGCLIKVFAQVEFGRYAISSGETTMIALAKVPGPRIAGGNWLLWYFVLVLLASFAQLGGIVGGVGQSLAISLPVTAYGRLHNDWAEAETAALIARRKWKNLTVPSAQRPGAKAAADPLVAARREEELLDPDRLVQTADEVLATASAAAAQRVDLLESLTNANATPELIEEREAARQWESVAGQLRLAAWPNIAEGPDSRDAARTRAASYLVDVVTLRDEMRASDAAPAAGADDGNSPGRRFPAERVDAVEQFETIEDFPEASVDYYTAARRDVPSPNDHTIWATIVSLGTVVLLVLGRYGLIQWFSAFMVASFTAMTVVNVGLLQSDPDWRVDWSEIGTGLSFRLPPGEKPGDTLAALGLALSAFGIIGVGATELVTYPYWCIEKGYALWTGRRSEGLKSPQARAAWVARGRGWLRVMRVDAFSSMVIYTFATIAFYLQGAAVLHPLGLEPKGPEMIRSLSVMYRPAFGPLAQAIFLYGACAVLYSTFFVANASNARVTSDVVRVLGLGAMNDVAHRRRVVWLSGLFPMICLVCYIALPEPTTLVLFSGFVQMLMLPMLAGAALYFRYRWTDEALRPGPAWDAFLWLSAIALLVAGLAGAATQSFQLGDTLRALFARP